MNTKNNKRRRDSRTRIEMAFIELLQEKNLKEITVSDIIKTAELNRSTFYANYLDIFDLADKTREQLENSFSGLFADYDYFNEHTGVLKMFTHIKENMLFYTTYFKLCYDDRHLVTIYDPKRAEQERMDVNINYHIEFFRSGLNAIIKLWLAGGCKESPEEMAEVIKSEYRGRYLDKQYKTHRMNLRPSPFELIASGRKTFELRLNDEKRRAVEVEDRIVFTNTEDGRELEARVIALHRFESFAELYASLPLERCGYLPEELETARPSDMEEYYTPEQQSEHGVLGIEIELL